MTETTPDTTKELATKGAMGDNQPEDEKIKGELTVSETEEPSPKRDLRFWLVFVALCSTTLLSAFDLGGVGNAAPTIVQDLNGEDFTWVVSAYALSSAACIPLSGNLAQIFGRRPIVFGAILLFAAGSAISGSAHTMIVLIVGRAIQGIGGGGVQSLTSIIISDLVPLRERGLFQGITGVVWTLGTSTGPFIAGSLAQKASWRWLFYMNIPLCAMSFLAVALFLNLRTPRESLREKLAKIDWFGNMLIMASACSMMIGLTWGGVRYPWSSFRILLPLIVGIVGMVAALYYESRWPKYPAIPIVVLSNRTSFSGYFATFIQGMVLISLAFFLPTWFQAVRGASPIVSALYFLPLTAVISPSGIVQGLLVKRSGRYRSLNFAAWCLTLVGVGLLICVRPHTPIVAWVFIQMAMGIGSGFLYTTTFAVLAPLPLEVNPMAVALLVFLRVFSQAWGVAIGGTILQNALKSRLPTALLENIQDGAQIAYAIIPLIPTMAEPLRSQVQDAFFQSLRFVWIEITALCGVGLLSFFAMKDVPLRKSVDKQWGISKVKDSTETTTQESQQPQASDIENRA